MTEYLPQYPLDVATDFESEVDWGALDRTRPHLGVLRHNPNIAVRWFAGVGADVREDVDIFMRSVQAEHQRLRMCGVRVPAYTHVPCQESDDTWNAYLLTARLTGEAPNARDPSHVPHMFGLARGLLRYYGTTPRTGSFLFDIGRLQQYTVVLKGGCGVALPGAYLHDIEPLLGGTEQDNADVFTLEQSIGHVWRWIHQLPDNSERASLMALANNTWDQARQPMH